jgi:hypothetical protein
MGVGLNKLECFDLWKIFETVSDSENKFYKLDPYVHPTDIHK